MLTEPKQEDDFSEKLKELEKKIDKAKPQQENDSPKRAKLGAEKVLAELVAGILFGLFVGYYLDDYFDTKPFFMLLLIILGLAGSFYNIYKDAVKEEHDN